MHDSFAVAQAELARLAGWCATQALWSTRGPPTTSVVQRPAGRAWGATRLLPIPADAASHAAVERRCRGTLGSWCFDYLTQAEVPARTAPRGQKTCSMECNKARLVMNVACTLVAC